MIKWMLTTIILAAVLVVTVVAVSLVLHSPKLKAKSEQILKSRTGVLATRIDELRGIIRGHKPSQPPQTPAKPEPAAETGSTSKTPPQPSQDDQIPDSDRKQLEEVLEKASR